MTSCTDGSVCFAANLHLQSQNGVTAQNGEQPIRLPNGLLYPRVEVELRTHSGNEIEQRTHSGDEIGKDVQIP